MIVALLIGSILNLVVGFIAGKFHERIEWNKLIHRWQIRRP